MRVLVMGAGALGGYFGARMQAAGHDVTYVARGAHLEAMQAAGLRVESPLGDLVLPQVRAVAAPSEAPPADVALVMVKNRDLEAAAAALAPVMRPGAVALTVQNGVSAPHRLASILGTERVVAGAVYMPADIRAPGVIRHSAAFHALRAGSLPGGPVAAADALVAAVAEAGIDAARVDDIDALLWEKFVLLAPMAAICALTRLDVGPIRDCPETLDLLRRAMEETQAVGRAVCATLPEDTVARHMARFVDEFPAAAHASMLDDLTRGKPLELEWLSGEIVRLGRVHGLPTPVHEVARAALLPYANGAP
jgi:2-dehydropantoate 2-reductase